MNLLLFDRDEIGADLPRGDDRVRHMIEVLRVRPGDRVRVGIINGSQGLASVRAISERGMSLDPDDAVMAAVEAEADWEPTRRLHPITCLLGHPRPPVLQRLLRDCTTMGAGSIIVTGAEMGEKSYFQSRLWRDGEWRKWLIAGAMQAGDTMLPVVQRCQSLAAALKRLDEPSDGDPSDGAVEGRILFDPAATRSSIAKLDMRGYERAVVAVGPERGWSPAELRLFREAGFSVWSLGRRILRTETAAIIGLLVVVERMGLL